jgi:hypothetical protein
METYKDALNLYRKALAAGNEEARPRIKDLEKKYRNL